MLANDFGFIDFPIGADPETDINPAFVDNLHPASVKVAAACRRTRGLCFVHLDCLGVEKHGPVGATQSGIACNQRVGRRGAARCPVHAGFHDFGHNFKLFGTCSRLQQKCVDGFGRFLSAECSLFRFGALYPKRQITQSGNGRNLRQFFGQRLPFDLQIFVAGLIQITKLHPRIGNLDLRTEYAVIIGLQRRFQRVAHVEYRNPVGIGLAQMCGHIAVGPEQVGHFDWEFALVLAVAAKRADDCFARIAVIAFDELVFGVGDGRLDILIGWAATRQTGFEIGFGVF